jgi:hypothetical protein
MNRSRPAKLCLIFLTFPFGFIASLSRPLALSIIHWISTKSKYSQLHYFSAIAQIIVASQFDHAPFLPFLLPIPLIFSLFP